MTESILSIPSGKFSRHCINYPIPFKSDGEFSCLAKNDATMCTSVASFVHYNSIEIDSNGNKTTYVTPIVTCKTSTDLQPVACRDAVYDGLGCNNAVTQIEYFFYTGEDGYILYADIELTLSTLVSVSTWIPIFSKAFH